MSLPLVSIVIPCWNGERFVADAIESALAQTYPHVEIIVIDDGSTDRTADVLRSFGDRIRWESGPNRGACIARNRGLELARGKLIQFLDADDILFPNKVERMAPLAIDNIAIPTCGWQTVSAAGETATTFPGEIGVDSFEYALTHSIQTAAPLHQRERLLESGGFRAELPCSQERDLHIRLAATGARFTAVNAALLQARRRANSLSSSTRRVLVQHEDIFLRARDILAARDTLTETRRLGLARALVRDARALVRIGDYETAARYALHARSLHRSGGMDVFQRWPSRTLARVAGLVCAERTIQSMYAAFRGGVHFSSTSFGARKEHVAAAKRNCTWDKAN